MSPSQPLFCRSFGAGPRHALALHCTMAHSGAWRGLAQAMDGALTIHATDMFNHGRSPDWDRAGDFSDRMVEAAGAHLQPGWDVIGHSFGATVALRLAVEFPERVRSLTMIEAVFFPVPAADHPDMLAEEQAGAAAFHAALRDGDAVRAARLFNGGWGGGLAWDDLPEARREAMARGVQIVPACSPAILHDRPGLMRPGVLEGLRPPLLLLRGDKTAPIIGAVNDGLAARVPGARNVVIPGAGHMLPISHPEATAAALRDFLSETGGAG